MSHKESPATGSSVPFEYVFEQNVRASKVPRFYVLNERLRTLASRQPGFIHQERRTISEGRDVWKFQTTLVFDTAAHCVAWLENPDRRRLLRDEEAEAGFAFQGHANWDGYSRWLSRSLTSEPPKWKINLLVLLTLFPTCMALTPILHITMHGVRMPIVMLVSNALCVAATSWLLVPPMSRLYARWLEGGLTPVGRLLALTSVLALIALLLALCLWLPPAVWG